MLVSVRLDDGETKIVMAKDGAILKTARNIIERLKRPDSKVLLYGESRSGKKAIAGVAANAFAGMRYRIMPYSGIRSLSQKDLEENVVSVFKDVDMSDLLDLGEKNWQYRNSNGENIDLGKSKILFDFSGPAEVRSRITDLEARSISTVYHPCLGESKDTLLDAAFFIGDLLSNAKKNIETSVFAALLLYPYGPGEGWNKLNEMVSDVISKAQSRGGDCVTRDDFQDISGEDTSRIIVKSRTRSEDKLEMIAP
jgi:hypothetical protein